MLIFDAHLDLAWNALEWNRNLELSVAEIREFERQFDGIIPGDCTVSYPELTRGGIGLVIATLLPRLKRKDTELTFYQGRESSYGAAYGQLAYYRSLERKGILKSLPSARALSEHKHVWLEYLNSLSNVSSPLEGRGQVRGESTVDQPTLQRSVKESKSSEFTSRNSGQSNPPPIGYILSMEGAPPILEPAQVQEWYDAGLRIVGPGHYGPNEYCHGTGSFGPLTADGVELLKEMDRVGMLLDATHLADESFWQALDVYGGPVLASHHNCRALVPGDRQLDDDQIQALIARGAVIGAAFDNWMLKPNYIKKVTPPDQVSLEDVVDHIDHVCQLAGNANHSGIGTDLDGGFGKEQSPGDLETIADLYRIAEILDARHYSSEDIERIMWRNFVEFFESHLVPE